MIMLGGAGSFLTTVFSSLGCIVILFGGIGLYMLRPKKDTENNYSASRPKTIHVKVVNGRTSLKSKYVAFALCLFAGYFGAHYFYVGRKGRGILYLFTVGLFGLGWLYDCFAILTNRFTDSNGWIVC